MNCWKECTTKHKIVMLNAKAIMFLTQDISSVSYWLRFRYRKLTNTWMIAITFSLYIFLSLPASASMGWSRLFSSSHIAPLPVSSFVETVSMRFRLQTSKSAAEVCHKLQASRSQQLAQPFALTNSNKTHTDCSIEYMTTNDNISPFD